MKFIKTAQIKLLLFLVLYPVFSFADEYATGSGFFITPDGYFATNFHVISDATSIVIRDVHGNLFSASLVRVDKSNDLAILKVQNKVQAIPIENSSSVKRGSAVVAIGFPHIDVQGLEPKVTDGLVNSLTGIQDNPKYFQISTAVQSGNSGGPLLNMYGNIVGLVTAKLGATEILKTTGDLTQNVNYAVKSNYLLELATLIPLVKSKLIPVNKKKLSDVAGVYASVENSIGLVIAKHNKPEVTVSSDDKIIPSKPKDWIADAENVALLLKSGEIQSYGMNIKLLNDSSDIVNRPNALSKNLAAKIEAMNTWWVIKNKLYVRFYNPHNKPLLATVFYFSKSPCSSPKNKLWVDINFDQPLRPNESAVYIGELPFDYTKNIGNQSACGTVEMAFSE